MYRRIDAQTEQRFSPLRKELLWIIFKKKILSNSGEESMVMMMMMILMVVMIELCKRRLRETPSLFPVLVMGE